MSLQVDALLPAEAACGRLMALRIVCGPSVLEEG